MTNLIGGNIVFVQPGKPAEKTSNAEVFAVDTPVQVFDRAAMGAGTFCVSARITTGTQKGKRAVCFVVNTDGATDLKAAKSRQDQNVLSWIIAADSISLNNNRTNTDFNGVVTVQKVED